MTQRQGVKQTKKKNQEVGGNPFKENSGVQRRGGNLISRSPNGLMTRIEVLKCRWTLKSEEILTDG